MKFREFKGQSVYGGDWAYGDLVHLKGEEHIMPLPNLYTKVKPETVCIYTGLWDKNNKKVFVGDIIKFTKRTVEYTGVVIEKDYAYWVMAHAGFLDYFYLIELKKCEDCTVVANVHDNLPEYKNINEEYKRKGIV